MPMATPRTTCWRSRSGSFRRSRRAARSERVMLTSVVRSAIWIALAALLVLALPGAAVAHGVSARDAQFVQSIDGPAIGPFLYLGAKHMVTGYDHLLFLIGVIFF